MKIIVAAVLTLWASYAAAQGKASPGATQGVTVKKTGVKIGDCTTLDFRANTLATASAGVCNLTPVPSTGSSGGIQYLTGSGFFGTDNSLTTDGSGNLIGNSVSTLCTPANNDCGDILGQNATSCLDPGGNKTVLCALTDGKAYRRAGGSSLVQLLDGGTNAGGDLTGLYPAPTLINTGTSTANCGDATHVCQVTTDAKGRVTTASSVTITAAGGGASSLVWEAPVGTVDSTANSITPVAATCNCRYAVFSGSAIGITQVAFDVTGTSAAAVNLGIYDSNGATRRFSCSAPVGSTGYTTCNNSDPGSVPIPAGAYWFCWAGAASSTATFAATPVYPSMGTFTQACAGGTLPASLTSPTATFTNNTRSIAFTLQSVGTTTTVVTTSSTSTSSTTSTTVSGSRPVDWTPTMSGLIAAYNFETSGNLGLNVAPATSCGGSASNCNLTINGTVTSDTSAFREDAASAQFTNTSSAMQCSDPPCTSLNGLANGITEFGGWFRDDNNTVSGKIMINKGAAATTGWGMIRSGAPDSVQVSWDNGAGSVTTSAGSWTTDGSWHWIMGRFNTTGGAGASTAQIYFDGALSATQTNQTINPVSTANFGLGFTSTAGFQGHQDGIFFRDHATVALTDLQICRIKSCGITGNNCTCNGTVYKACNTANGNADCQGGSLSPSAICDAATNTCSGRNGGTCSLSGLACNATAP